MAMGRRKAESQGQMFIAISDLPATAGHPFYEILNRALRAMDFDRRVEEMCQKYYKEAVGRPSIPPGVYFRLLLIGYFEGIDSERGIAWRVADSLALRRFLGYDLQSSTPDHSSLSRIRWRLDGETHDQVFRMVLLALQEAGLIKGKTIGVDATTLGGQCRHAVDRAAGHGTELSGLSGAVGQKRGDRAAHAVGSGQAGQEPQGQRFQRTMGASA